MLNLKKMKENRSNVNVMKILNTEKEKMKNYINNINEKIKNTEIEKEKCIIYIYKKNVKITIIEIEKKNQIASVKKLIKKRKKNQNALDKIM